MTWLNKAFLIVLMVSMADSSLAQESCGSVFRHVYPRTFQKGIQFNITNRGFEKIQRVAKIPGFSMESFRGLKVLDVGCGGGALVKDLRSYGIEAYGIDMFLNPELQKSPFFEVRDAFATQYPKGSFDRVLSSFSIFLYDSSVNSYVRALQEFKRLLRPGGQIVLVAYSPQVLAQALPEVGGLALRFHNNHSVVLERLPLADVK